MIIHRFLLIRSAVVCINILSDAYSCARRTVGDRRRAPAGAAGARVAVAGATGYTGQELLRLLARHPAVDVTAAMSSGAARRARARCRRSRASGTAPSRRSTPDALAREADVVFLALPDTAAAELAPALVDAGVRVIDLSGAFRLRDAGAARALVSGDAPRCRTASPTG